MIGIVIIVLIAFGFYFTRPKTVGNTTPGENEILVNNIILADKVAYFKSLNKQQQQQFEKEITEFLSYVKITGVNTTVEGIDRVFVAASAVIPVFAFPEWKYYNLKEVLLYADTFNTDFKTEGGERNILGMVGTGYMEGKMLLSKAALELGFKNDSDKNNTAIHEFVHLIDKTDGDTDGIPSVLLLKQYTIPWLDMMYQQIQEILKNKSDINPYGSTNKSEFFAVVSEYFFERPDLLQKKHPELYALLQQLFKQDPATQLQEHKKNETL